MKALPSSIFTVLSETAALEHPASTPSSSQCPLTALLKRKELTPRKLSSCLIIAFGEVTQISEQCSYIDLAIYFHTARNNLPYEKLLNR